jgi:hypothetical protein
MRASVGAFSLALAFPLSASAQPTAGSWQTHTDPSGFSVNLPTDWNAQRDASSGRIDLWAPDGNRVIVWPVFIPDVALQDLGAASVLGQMAQRLWPEAQWTPAQPAGPRVARTTSQRSDSTGVALFTWTPTPRGTAGQVNLVYSPTLDAMSANSGVFAEILRSFRSWGAAGPGQQGASPMRYVRWQDPTEGAFSTEIPEGWSARGGIVRPNLVGYQAYIETFPQDNASYIYVGDTYPTFSEPDAMQQQFGVGYGGLPVAAYMEGTNFLTGYALAQRYGAGEFQVDGVRDRPDLAQTLNSLASGAGLWVRYSAGEVDYHFLRGGQTMRGNAIGITYRVAMPGVPVGMWGVVRVALCEAIEGRLGEAQRVLAHMAESEQVNPQWVQAQSNTTMQQSQIIAGAQRDIGNMISQSYQTRSESQDRAAERFDQSIRGVETVVDPGTGTRYEVESGATSYWLSPNGTVVGTDSAFTPDPSVNFQELIRPTR